jgi:hypothetical protein
MLSERARVLADTALWVVQPAAASQRRRHVRVQVEEPDKFIPRQAEAASQVRWKDIPTNELGLSAGRMNEHFCFFTLPYAVAFRNQFRSVRAY